MGLPSYRPNSKLEHALLGSGQSSRLRASRAGGTKVREACLARLLNVASSEQPTPTVGVATADWKKRQAFLLYLRGVMLATASLVDGIKST